MCVRVFSVGFGPGLDSMSPARSRRSASHAPQMRRYPPSTIHRYLGLPSTQIPGPAIYTDNPDSQLT